MKPNVSRCFGDKCHKFISSCASFKRPFKLIFNHKHKQYLERIRSWLPDRFWVPWDKASCSRTLRPGRVSRRLVCRNIVGQQPAARLWNSRCIRDLSLHIARSWGVRTTLFSWWLPRPRNTRPEIPPCRSSHRRTRLTHTPLSNLVYRINHATPNIKFLCGVL